MGAVRTGAVLFVVVVSSFTGVSAREIGIGDFSGGETVIGFDSLPDSQVVTNQFAGLGVTFAGVVEADPITVNWLPQNSSPPNVLNNNSPQGTELTFALGVNRVGAFFLHGTTSVSLSVFDASNNLLETATVAGVFGTEVFEGFVGIESATDIARAVFLGTAPNPSFFALDDVRFEAISAPIPEPGTWALLGVCLFGAGLVHRRRQAKKS